jgi:hypothetical protein
MARQLSCCQPRAFLGELFSPWCLSRVARLRSRFGLLRSLKVTVEHERCLVHSLVSTPTQSAPPYDLSTHPSTVSRQESFPPSGSILNMRSQVGPPSGLNSSHPNHIAMPPAPSLVSGSHNLSYDSASASPGTGSLDQPIWDTINPTAPGTPNLSHSQLSSAGLQAQKERTANVEKIRAAMHAESVKSR